LKTYISQTSVASDAVMMWWYVY